MGIEKEVRYKINSKQKDLIIRNTQEIEAKKNTTDLVMGWNGFESLSKYGFICRIRQNSQSIELQAKKLLENNHWEETNIKLENLEQGYNLLKTLKMEPYLYINRNRQVRKYKSLKVFIDEIDLLGDYVELEFQDSSNPDEEIRQFKQDFQVDAEEAKLYGDIFKERIETEKGFKEKFMKRIEEVK